MGVESASRWRLWNRRLSQLRFKPASPITVRTNRSTFRTASRSFLALFVSARETTTPYDRGVSDLCRTRGLDQ
jgi:hypothetical protein